MNELQKIEFDLLRTFVEICKKLNLNYYLVCGTALGAAKYNGFIPWDDDIDVALCREDYKLFCQKAQQLLPEHIFLQTYKTDPHYPCIHAKLRNSNTTYVEKSYKKISMNHGIYIDIFPLDGYPKKKREQNRLERKKILYQLLISSAYETNCSLKTKLIRKFFRLIGVHKKTDSILEKYEKLISSFPINDSDLWCNHGNWQGKLEYAPKEQYGKGTLINFEGMQVRVPQKYDEYLTQKYGDWRTDLPQEQQKGHHYYVVMNVNLSYTDCI